MMAEGEMRTIPVVDVATLRSGADALRVGRELCTASREWGFLYVAGHGLDPSMIEGARRCALEFFRAAPERKNEVRVSPRHRGWLATGGARMDDDLAPDLKESFIWGFQDEAGRTPQDHPLRGPNQWPAFLPALEAHGMAWFEAASALARDLLAGFAAGLGLAPDVFTRDPGAPLSRASFVHYPPRAEKTGEDRFGVGPHTDFGVLTVLAQDDVGGLEVEDAQGRWTAAPPLPGTLVVNVGDLLDRWTGGLLKSTPHRVINRSSRERLSLVLAFDPGPATPIDPRALLGAAAGTLTEPVTCGDYLEARFARAFAYRKG